MEANSPPPSCPNTVTIRRNPPRRARPTPYSAAPLSRHPSASKTASIRSFPIDDILSINVPDQPIILVPSSSEPLPSEKLKVFLRIRPIVIIQQQKVRGSPGKPTVIQKNVWPRKKEVSRKTTKKKTDTKDDVCLKVIDSHSVTLHPPQSLADARRIKSEVYEGFSHVFCPESTQSEVYEEMVKPLVIEFLKGKSGMLAALGPSGSGKTHTVFGRKKDPGMVALALRHIFTEKENNGSKHSRTFYLSMFEIYSERGKGEKIMDLSHDGGDLVMQQSNIKGLQEVVIHDVQEAESLIAYGMLKRSTAMTNSNIQSSRSQCIINIRCDFNNPDEDDAAQSCTAVLTIVDLAGAEREKKTGNQGSRLQESNFINNTSMVFKSCLRSLLEHQKHPKKTFHNHTNESLLTRYLRDFLEGKKRMSLLLTAKAGEEDYQDTSYLLRQASPYMNIKFENVEQPTNTLGIKRRTQVLPKTEQAKRMKINSKEGCVDDAVKGVILHQPHKEDPILEKDIDHENNVSSSECPAVINVEAKDKSFMNKDFTALAEITRENQILSKFSRALWNVLKEYKTKLETSEKAVESLQNSLNAEQERCSALETELDLMKALCSNTEENGSNAKSTNCSFQSVDVHQKESVPCEYVLFDKEDLTELGDLELGTEVSGCDTVESTVKDSISGAKLLVHEVEGTPSVKEDQVQQEEEELKSQVTSLDPNELECLQKQDILDDIKQSDCDTFESAVINSEVIVHGDETSSLVKGDLCQHKEEESSAQRLVSDLCESDLVKDVLEDKEVSLDGVISISSDDEKCEELFNEQGFKEVVGKEADEEFAVADSSKLLSVAEDENSSTSEEKQEESSVEVIAVSSDSDRVTSEEQINEKVDVSCSNAVLNEQDFKEVVKKEADENIADSSKLPPVAEDEKLSTSEEIEVVSDKTFVLKDDVTTRGCKASKLSEATNAQLCQPVTSMKPKRRLRPASSVMLRNINVADFDDATELPKHQGKRGEKQDAAKKLTQGSISLLRLLKPNLHR
ncbi:kinesin-like protein KIN-6 [Rutidosis leptorrhynchoides]|uniref:kinesin-like protein KIN-6 n=1 Tax=Rutidosis leptorrhynchoides TaxID=125765 RepID=UPI003A99A3E7